MTESSAVENAVGGTRGFLPAVEGMRACAAIGVVITHAHIDHSGLLPRLVARGFSGPVYATPATIDLLGVMLPDSAHIHEMEFARAHDVEARHHGRGARFPNRGGPRGDPAAAPLYTVADAQRSLALLVPVAYDRLFEPKASIRFRFRDAGHILGSAIVEAWIDEDGAQHEVAVVRPGRVPDTDRDGKVTLAMDERVRCRPQPLRSSLT